jgi:hypothetical protein
LSNTLDIYDHTDWTDMDIEDLKSDVEYGSTIEQIAEFLCRSGSVEDVASKAEELGLTPSVAHDPKMVVYCGWTRDTAVDAIVQDLGCGAGRIKCLECGGDGNWGKFAPEIVGPDAPCVDCKGTGYQLVSI